MALSSTRIVDCAKLEKQIENKTLFTQEFGRTLCWIYFFSKCQFNRLDLIQNCNETHLGGDLTGWRDLTDPYVPRALAVLNRRKKEEILTHPTNFVVGSKWEGEDIPVDSALTSASETLFGSAYYQGSLKYVVNYVEKLRSMKFGRGSGLEVTLKVPQANPATYGVINQMEGFILDFVPPRYISGAKR